MDNHPLDQMGTGRPDRLSNAEPIEDPDRLGIDVLRAGLVTREPRLVEQHHLVSRCRQETRERASTRTTADDHYLDVGQSRERRRTLAWESH
jgi:hypothetical protein